MRNVDWFPKNENKEILSLKRKISSNHMEEIHNLITGSFVEYEIVKNEFVDSEEEEEEGGDEDIQWLEYKEVSDINGGKNFVSYDKPKLKTGELIDIVSRKPQKCRGPILLFKQWWQITFLRTKISQKDKFTEPKDRYALCYRLRDDRRCRTDKLANLLISDILRLLENPDLFDTRLQFEQYLRETRSEASLDLTNLQEHLDTFCERYSDPEEKMTPQINFKNAIVNSGQFHQVKIGQSHPQLLHYLPQVFPFHFMKILTLRDDILDDLVKCIEEEPGNLAFKAILSKRYSVLGVETSKDALIKAGLMSKVPKEQQDAIDIYEYLKTQTKEYGHTWILYDKILTTLSKEVTLWDEAMEFLNKHKITRTQMEAGYRIVYLQNLWKAENQIAKGINSLIRKNEIQPWNLDVDLTGENFQSIMADNDQKRAALLITSQPVCAISGKGGCGKTYVVTQVLKAAQANRSKWKDMHKDKNNEFDDDMTQMEDEGIDDPQIEECNTDSEKCPDDVNILLTAPTGKAANLLGKRADLTSCTLHQVIWSYRMLKPGLDWKHKDVNILVVDECSLVSVTTMAFLLELLIKNSKLRRIVLLGDIRQLPSIEPGNFLKDAFQSLDVIGFSVELRTNHRAESQAIVDNATAISLKQFPKFDKEKFMFRRLPDNNPESNGNDYMLQDINDDIIKLLSHESLKSHVNSQFISFTRRVCDAVNDLCCKHYSKHRIKEFKKFVFRTGDKICCCKNGYVNIYEEKHGLMSCTKDSNEGEKQEAGGVDRTILTGMANDTVVGGEGDKTINPEQAGKKPNPTKQIRLCNGEIFFITEEIERLADNGKIMTFLGLSEDGDVEKTFWVEKKQIRKSCKIRHAWARTIHTFQGSETDHVVYIVGSRSWRQNWQHVYTAVTRGRKTVFIIGQESVLRAAIKRSEIRRQTGLKKQLLKLFQKDKILSPTHAVDSTILCAPDKPETNKLNKTAQWLADCTRLNGPSTSKGVPDASSMFTKNRLNLPSTSRRELDMSGNFNNTQAMTDILSSLASEHDPQYYPDGDDTCPPEDTSDRDSPSLLDEIPGVYQPISTQDRVSNSDLQQQRRVSNDHHRQPNGMSNNIGHLQRASSRELRQSHRGSNGNTREAFIHQCEDRKHGEDVIEEFSSDEEANVKHRRHPGKHRLFIDGDRQGEDDVSVTVKVKHRSTVDDYSQEIDDVSDTDSNQSESLLTTPSPVGGYTKLKSRSERECETKGGNPTNNRFVKEGSNICDMKMKQNVQDTISPIISSSSLRHFNDVGNHGYGDGTGQTPSDLSIKGKLLMSNHSTKLSPFTPLSTGNRHLHNTVDHFTSSPEIIPTHIHSPNSVPISLSAACDIKEPKSNESMWSEVDDSVYLDVSDTNLLVNQTSPAVTCTVTPSVHCQSIPGDVRNRLGRDSANFSSDRISPLSLSNGGYRNRRLSKTPNVNNQSTCSQWSEVDDDQYITALDLADIEHMETQRPADIEHMATQRPTDLSNADIENTATQGFPVMENMPNQSFTNSSNEYKVQTPHNISEPFSNTRKSDVISPSELFSNYRQTDVTPPSEMCSKPRDVTPPDGDDLDDSIISNTPPEQTMGIKRQLSWNQKDVSPMKRRLATLKFE